MTAFPAIGGPLPKLAPLLAEGLAREGCDVRVAGWSAHTAGREPAVAKVVGRAGDFLRVLRRIRSWRPHVVYVATAHNWPGLLRDVPLALAVSRAHPPLVFHLHGSESGRLLRPGSQAFKVFSALLVRRAAAILLLSTEERREWLRFCPAGRFDVVLNPFVPDRDHVTAPRSHDGVPTLFTVARMIPSKGIFDLLDAFAILRRQQLCRLVYAGAGPAADQLAARAGELGVSGDVELLGYVSGDALDAAYRRAAVFVLPTYFAEGFPLAVMEAMSYGLPIVTTRIRGCADWLEEGKNAVFVPPRDSKALAAVLEQLLRDDRLQERMGAANRALTACFAPNVVVPKYAEILREAAGRDTR